MPARRRGRRPGRRGRVHGGVLRPSRLPVGVVPAAVCAATVTADEGTLVAGTGLCRRTVRLCRSLVCAACFVFQLGGHLYAQEVTATEV